MKPRILWGLLVALLLALTASPVQARYYQPQTGRFQTMDSYEGSQSDPQSLHKYVYADGNPVNSVDPSGRFSLTIQLGSVQITGRQLAAIGIVSAATVYGSYQFNKHVIHPYRLLLNSAPFGGPQLESAQQQLRRYQHLNPNISLLLNSLDDGRVTVRVISSGAGKHNATVRGTLFVARTAIDQPDNGLAAALVVFGEFQHDPESGAPLGEDEAQVEFIALREAIRRINPGAITPYIDNLKHGGN